MSLLLKRVFPQAADFDGNVGRLRNALRAVESMSGSTQGASERFTLLMEHGLTIFLPGEEPDPFVSLMDSTPFMARFGNIPQMNGGEGVDDDTARKILHKVLKGLMKRLRGGARLEVMPGRWWQLMTNKALMAELAGPAGSGSILLEERLNDPDKPLPDAIHSIQRIDQHAFLADLLSETPGAAGADDHNGEQINLFEQFNFHDIADSFGSGFDAGLDDDDDPKDQ